MWQQLPIGADFDVGKWETLMNDNSHHFILFRYIDDGNPNTPPPTLNVWNPHDAACLSGGGFQENLTGAQDPHVIEAYPDGLARTLHPGDIVGLNSHYINTLNVPIQGHVYVNVYPYSGTQPHHTAKTLFATDANYSTTGIGIGAGGSGGILPFHTGVTEGDWVNFENPGVCLVYLTSHMHKRGILFTEEYPVGNQVYNNSDWDHPYVLGFPAPLWIPQNDVIHYECTHDNGFSNPNDVKRNSNGIPAKLHFGLSADDEMCIMPGLYFVPAVAGTARCPEAKRRPAERCSAHDHPCYRSFGERCARPRARPRQPGARARARHWRKLATECIVEYDGFRLNYPPPPSVKRKEFRCFDGDPTCDTDGVRNGSCAMSVSLCFAGNDVPGCTAGTVSEVKVSNPPPTNPKHDPALAALQSAGQAVLPTAGPNVCGAPAVITVPIGKKSAKKLKVRATSSTGKDSDSFKLRCVKSGWTKYMHDLSNSGSNPDETTLGVANVGSIVQKWEFVVKDKATPHYISAAPTVADDRVYIGSWNGMMYALRATDGKVLWKFDTADPNPGERGGLRESILRDRARRRTRVLRGGRRQVLLSGRSRPAPVEHLDRQPRRGDRGWRGRARVVIAGRARR